MPLSESKVPETALRKLLFLDSLCGRASIRNEKGWLDNERVIEYSWIVTIDHAFRGQFYLFAVKFGANAFRGANNPEELLLGIMQLRTNGEVNHYYMMSHKEDMTDPIRAVETFRLFEGDSYISLDGVSYTVDINAPNIKSQLTFSNPQSEHWKVLANNIWRIAVRLASDSGNHVFINFTK